MIHPPLPDWRELWSPSSVTLDMHSLLLQTEHVSLTESGADQTCLVMVCS